MQAFPTSAPFRVDQVTAAPLAMTALFLAMATVAGVMAWAAGQQRRGLWWGSGAVMLTLVVVFFSLANWGNSDTTKLSHYLSFDFSRVRGEPFWMITAPLLMQLPYRMATAHGLVSAGFAAAAMLLARRLGASAWAGWWALLICCSPMLRNFFQNGVTRQALATLLLLPVLLWATRMAPLGPLRTGLTTLWAATVHTTFLGTLLLALLPRLLGLPTDRAAEPPPPRHGTRPRRNWSLRLWLPRLAIAGTLLVLVGLAAPHVAGKLTTYLSRESFFSSYILAAAVGRLELAMVVGVVMTCWLRRLGWHQLLGCARTRQLALFAVLFLAVQASVAAGWQAQITSRFADVIGLFLLVIWLGWLAWYRCLWAVLPALAVTFEAWIVERLLGSLSLSCGRNDDFLCVPDRWPWQVRY